MDLLSATSPVVSLSVMKGSQGGWTKALGGAWMGYSIDQVGAETLIVLPTMSVCNTWVKRQLQPALQYVEVLQSKLRSSRERDGGNTKFLKEFSNGSALVVTWSSSAAGLKSISARHLLFDEADSFADDADGEGDPIHLAERRSTNFVTRKSVKLSTPTEDGKSRIQKEYLLGDRRRFFVPCPHCGHFQIFILDNFRVFPETRRPEEVKAAWFECVHCRRRIDEHSKAKMLPAGVYIPTRNRDELITSGIKSHDIEGLLVEKQMSKETVISMHWPTFLAPLGWEGSSWHSIGVDLVKKRDDLNGMKSFWTHTCGEAFKIAGDAPDDRRLYDQAEPYPIEVVPAGAYLLTLAGDIQVDRIECEVRGWGRNHESWSVAYYVLPGDTSTDAPWVQLQRIIEREFPHAEGGSLPVWIAAIDCGYRAEQTYRFCQRYPQPNYGPMGTVIHRPQTVIPVNGGYSPTRLVESISSADAARRRGGLHVVRISGVVAKDSIYDRLKRPLPLPGETPQRGTIHFPRYKHEYFLGLTAERRHITGGRVSYEKHFHRNEPLDCAVYQEGLAGLMDIDNWPQSRWEFLERMARGQRGLERQKAAELPRVKPVSPNDPWL